MAGEFGTGLMRGLDVMQVSVWNGTDWDDPFELGCPQVLSWDEEFKNYEWPGPDSPCQTELSPYKLKVTLEFSQISIEHQAKMIGAAYGEAGTTPNRRKFLVRKTSDVAPNLMLKGVVKHANKNFPAGQYEFNGAWGTVTSAPGNHAQEVYKVKMTLEFIKRPSDSAYYNQQMWETAPALPTAADNTVMTVSTVVPADNATAQLATVNIVLTFSKDIIFLPSNFKLYKQVGVSLLAVTLPDSAITYDVTTHVVTINPPASLDAGATYVPTAEGVQDLWGNTMATFTSEFTVAS